MTDKNYIKTPNNLNKTYYPAQQLQHPINKINTHPRDVPYNHDRPYDRHVNVNPYRIYPNNNVYAPTINTYPNLYPYFGTYDVPDNNINVINTYPSNDDDNNEKENDENKEDDESSETDLMTYISSFFSYNNDDNENFENVNQKSKLTNESIFTFIVIVLMLLVIYGRKK